MRNVYQGTPSDPSRRSKFLPGVPSRSSNFCRTEIPTRTLSDRGKPKYREENRQRREESVNLVYRVDDHVVIYKRLTYLLFLITVTHSPTHSHWYLSYLPRLGMNLSLDCTPLERVGEPLHLPS